MIQGLLHVNTGKSDREIGESIPSALCLYKCGCAYIIRRKCERGYSAKEIGQLNLRLGIYR